jgi:hypothetical protein
MFPPLYHSNFYNLVHFFQYSVFSFSIQSQCYNNHNFKLNFKHFIILPDAAIGIFFLYFPLQNSENKVSILTKSGKNLSFLHQRNGFNMSSGFIEEKNILNP